MAKFIEIYFHFSGQSTVRRFIVNTDDIVQIEEYKNSALCPDGRWKVYTECILLMRDGTRCVLEQNRKEKIIQQLLEL